MAVPILEHRVPPHLPAQTVQKAALLVASLPLESVVNEAVGAAIAKLWSSEPIQRAFAERALYNLDECVAPFCNRITDICAPNYIPSIVDMLLARAQTTGIIGTRTERSIVQSNHDRSLVPIWTSTLAHKTLVRPRRGDLRD